jgi:hypothetical protein
MVITDYQVQSLLRTYARQLRLKLANTTSENGCRSRAARMSASDDGKRQLLIERFTTQVFETMYPRQDEEVRVPESV